MRQGARLYDSPCDLPRDPWFRITQAERQRQPCDSIKRIYLNLYRLPLLKTVEAGALTGLSNSACIGVLQFLCTVTEIRKLDMMAELGKILKEALVYSGLNYCNNNPTVNYTMKEKRLTVDFTHWKRELLVTIT